MHIQTSRHRQYTHSQVHTYRTHIKLTDLDMQVHIMHTCSFTDTHKHTEYDRHYTYICKHTYTRTHTHTHRERERERERERVRQTDRHTVSYMQTDRQTHTHTCIEPSPRVISLS